MSSVEFRIPFVTFLKLFVALFVGYCLYLSWSLVLLFFLAILIAVTLQPVVAYLEKHRWPRWSAILLVAVVMTLSVVGSFMLLIPALSDQTGEVVTQFPAFRDKVEATLPSSVRPFLRSGKGISPKVEEIGKHLIAGSVTAFGGLLSFAIMLILSIYLLVDGASTNEWLLAFLSEENRKKARETQLEVSKIIVAYISGQFITSLFASVYVFAVMSFLQVPAALVLAFLAGVFDVLPVIGFFISFVPAVLLALTVSPTTAAVAGALYLFYHGFEAYFIVPKIYGNRLKVSGLVVLLALIVASTVGGVLGAIAILPIVASYPVIERIWLKKHVGNATITKHAKEGAEAEPPILR